MNRNEGRKSVYHILYLLSKTLTSRMVCEWIILDKLLDMLTSNITMYHLMSKRQRINWFNTRGKNSLIWPIPYVSALILVLLICEFHVCKILQCSVIKKEKCLIKNTTATGWLSLFIFIHVMLEKALHILKSYGTIKAVKIQSLYTSYFYIWVNQFYIYRFIKLFDSSLWHGGFSPQFVLITAEVNEKVLQNDLQWNYVSAAECPQSYPDFLFSCRVMHFLRAKNN